MASHRRPRLPDFERAFRQGQVFQLGDEEAVVSVTVIGHVDLRTGVVQIIDPLMYSEEPDDEPADLDPDAPPGLYRVERSDSDVPLAVRVVFADEPVVHWEPLGEAVGVDSGTIAFVDDSVLSDLSAMNDEERLLGAINAVTDLGGEVEVASREFGRVKMVVFGTGADGSYPSYWGIAKSGRKVCVVVDMGGLYVERESGPRIPHAALHALGPVVDPELETAGIALEIVRVEETQFSLKVQGYDAATTWEIRHADGTRVNHSKLFQRDKGILTFSMPKGLPMGAYLYIGVPGGLVPMVPTEEIRR